MVAQTTKNSADKVKTPFSREQRNQLLAWSKRAKEEELLPPFERKILYEGGHYNYIFVSRLNRLSKTLEMLVDQLDDETDLVRQIKDVGYCCYIEAQSENGDSEAQYILAEALYFGFFGLDSDEERALYWMRKASEQGHLDAECELARWYFYGCCGLEEDEQKAINLLEVSIERGSGKAHDLLGDWHSIGAGVEVELDLVKAFYHYSKASSAGLDDGSFHLGLCYENGEGTETDPKKAFEIMKSLADSGYSRGMRRMGYYYFQGIGTDANQTEALNFWHQAAKLNDGFSICAIGECYWFGHGVEEDDERAFFYFKKASDYDSKANHYLGLMHLSGRGCEEDNEKAFSYFSIAVESGIEEANYNLGMCYYFGWGCDQDYHEAHSCFRLSKKIDSNSLFYLGECARNGTGRKRSYEDAFEFYIQAADTENAMAQMAIGRAFYVGEGVREDDDEAVKWLELAVAQENGYAEYLLGECYLKGIGVSEDEAKGIALLRKAAESGETVALDLLHESGYELADETVGELSVDGDNLVGIHLDSVSRAKALYSKTIEKLRDSDQEKTGNNVVQLSIIGAERIEALMSRNDGEN